jgi:hypothetical protein
MNKCLGDILTNVSPPTRDNLKVSSISLPSNKRKPGCSHFFEVSTSLSQIASARPRNLTSHVSIDSTYLSSSKLTSDLRVQILSLINLHDDLCVMFRSINSVYSLRILVNVADAFIFITVSLFFWYFFSHGQQWKILTYTIFIICCSLMKR